MIIYSIKAILCALFFLFIYIALFEREKMHQFKRHYLLCSLALSFVIPLVALDITVPHLNEEISRLYTESKINERIPEQITFLINKIYPESNMVDLASYPATLLAEASAEDNATYVWLEDYVFIAKVLYILISLAIFVRLSRNLFRLLYSAKKGQRIAQNNKKIILIKENLAPFSFGTCIYINEDDYKNGLIAEDMIMHEQAHIEHRHSLDIIFIELLITIFWFNPALYLYRRKIKQNHEFMADEAVLKANNDVTRYQNILIGIISKNGSTGLASSLNYSTIKKRFIMMKKETSQRKARCRKTLLIPAMLLAICMFSTHTIATEPPLIITEYVDENKFQEEDFIFPGKGVSDELLKEFQDIVNIYSEKKTDEDMQWKSITLTEKDRNRLYTVFVQMNQNQRRDQWIYFHGPFTTINTSFKAPNKQQWENAKKAEVIWFNGKKVKVSELNTYTHNDIYFWDTNRINNQNSSVFWTKTGYEEYMEQYKDKVPLSVLLEIKPGIMVTEKKHTEGDKRPALVRTWN